MSCHVSNLTKNIDCNLFGKTPHLRHKIPKSLVPDSKSLDPDSISLDPDSIIFRSIICDFTKLKQKSLLQNEQKICKITA